MNVFKVTVEEEAKCVRTTTFYVRASSEEAAEELVNEKIEDDMFFLDDAYEAGTWEPSWSTESEIEYIHAHAVEICPRIDLEEVPEKTVDPSQLVLIEVCE